MHLLGYIVLYPIFWFISILPFRLLYFISDVLYFILYRIIGYRKAVVKQNLRLVFPEKSSAEINTIARKFYSHLCDLLLEMIKTLSISQEELNQRFIIKNTHTIAQLEAHKTSVIMMYGHYASYEWSSVLQSKIHMPGLGIYKKIANSYFDKLVRKIRSKYKTELVDSKQALNRIRQLHNNKDLRMIGFLSDQSPKIKPSNIWLKFMGITIPCFVGAELTATIYNYPVGYLKIEKTGRGYYEAEVIIISETPESEDKYAITKQFNHLLEEQIRNKPEFYLWTHKRWKHREFAPKEPMA